MNIDTQALKMHPILLTSDSDNMLTLCFIWILGNKAPWDREREEKQNQPDLPGWKQGIKVC